MKINGLEANYNSLNLYEGEKVVFHTSRPYGLDFEIEGISIRNARKIDFKKGDVFTVKSSKAETNVFRSGKDIYIPASVISVAKVAEVVHSNNNGEVQYINEYTLDFHCKAFRWIPYCERIYDFPKNTPLEDYDKNGKWHSGFRTDCNTYDTRKDKNGVDYVTKRWKTYESISKITVRGDYITRSEKSADRIERERLAEIINSCLYSNKTITHYEVEKLLDKLDIKVKA